jgi:hypothetical protein
MTHMRFVILVILAGALGLPGESQIVPGSRPRDEYTGRVMSLDMKGDLADFLQSIASISGLEVSIERSISRTVTVHLQDVPWDLALDVVLKNSGLSEKLDGKILRIARANPALREDHILLGTVTIEGKVTEFSLQNPRTLFQVNAPNAEGQMQIWRIEWESGDLLTSMGLRPNTLKIGDRLLVTGNLTRDNTIRLVIVRRLSDGFSWGDVNAVLFPPSEGLMFVSSSSR